LTVSKRKRRKEKSKDDDDDESNNESSSGSVAENPPKKRGRKPKAQTEDSTSSSDEEKPPKKRGKKPKSKIDTTVNDSLSSVTENPSKKRGRKPKSKSPAAKKPASDDDDGFSKEDLLPISAMASKKPGRLAAFKKEGDKAGLASVVQKKRDPKPSKLSKAAAKAKTAPITDFFAPKSTKSAAKDDGKGDNPALTKDEAVSTITNTETSEETERTSKSSNDAEGFSKTTGGTEGMDSDAKSTSSEKEEEIVDKSGDKNESITAAEEEPNSGTSAGEDAANEEDSGDDKNSDEDDDSAVVVDTPSTRPSRKRKLSKKAAEAAAITVVKNEEKEVVEAGGSEEEDVADSQPKSANASSDETTQDDEKEDNSDSSKDSKGKGSIVEAAKNAAAATLAAFSLFAPKPKSAEESETGGAEGQSVVSSSKEEQKSEVEGTMSSNTDSKVQDGEEASGEDTETAEPTEILSVSNETSPKPTDGATAANVTSKDSSLDSDKAAAEAPLSDAKMENLDEDVPTAMEQDDVAAQKPESSKNDSDQTIDASTTSNEKQVEKEKLLGEEDSAAKPTNVDSTEGKNAEISKSPALMDEAVEVQTKESNAQKEDASSLATNDCDPETQENLLNETVGSVSDANCDAIPMDKFESSPANEDTSAITSGDSKSTIGKENEAKTQESTTASEVLPAMTNGNGNQGDTEHVAMKKSAKERKIENMAVQESEENDAIQSSEGIIVDNQKPSPAMAVSLDHANPQSVTVNKDGVGAKGTDGDIQESKDLQQGVIEETPMAVEENGVAEGDEKKESDKANVNDQQTVPKEEAVEATSSNIAVDVAQNADDETKKTDMTDTEHVAKNVAEVKVNVEGGGTESHVVASTAMDKSTSDSLKEEYNSAPTTRENGKSSEPPKAAESEPKPSQSADDHIHSAENDSTEERVNDSDKDVSMEKNSELPVQADTRSLAGEEKTEASTADATAIPPLENSIDWKETVSIEPKADKESKGEASKVSESQPAASPVDTMDEPKNSEVVMGEHDKNILPSAKNSSEDSELNEGKSGDMQDDEAHEEIESSDKVGTNVDEADRIEPEQVATQLNGENPVKSDLLNTVGNEVPEEKSNQIVNHATVSGTSREDDSQITDKISMSRIPQIESSSIEVDPVSAVKKIGESNDPEGDSYKQVELNDQSGEVSSSEQKNAAFPNAEPKSRLETSANDKISPEGEKEIKTPDLSTERGEKKELVSIGSSNVDGVEVSKPQMEDTTVSTKSTELPAEEIESDEMDTARKDVSAVVESLLEKVECREKKGAIVSTDMEVDGTENLGIGNTGSALDEATEPDSMMAIEVATEVTLEPEDVVPSNKEEMKVTWVAVSKAPRQSKHVKHTSAFTGYDESKTNRVKMLLYTTGCKVHRGRGFERIFAMYWDAVCLHLSRPLNGNASKRCEEAISAFLKSRKLRKIHNKFVMSVMRRALKVRVPYSEVSDHLPTNWEERVKIPHIVSSRKATKKKNKTLNDGLEDDLLQLSSVPHLDNTTPYKERWEFPSDTVDEIQNNSQEGPTVPIASSCIPGALVVDPMLREIVEAGSMKVTDNAMWLLTVALKEHIKNILNDSIEYKKGLKKGEVFPQAIHYPNVLASSSTKNRKISKAKSSSSSLDNEHKKRINSIDLFAALNMLPSGQASSIGGSVSRMSLEQTFLSGFNSMPSFDTGNSFKDVQDFVLNTLTVMAKNRPPEEKKAKASHPKPAENSASEVQAAKDTAPPETVKTPTARQVSIPSSANTSESIATPMASLESPPLMQSMSPSVVQTPVSSRTTKTDASQSSTEKPKDAAMPKANATSSSQASETKAPMPRVAPKVENPTPKGPAAGIPSQTGPLRPGAGRGAKNLAALMARATESTTNSNDSVQGGDNSKPEPEKASTEKPASQPVADPSQPILDPPNNAESSKPANAQASAPRQPIAPVRRGKGKGFGSKDLAALRARSMTSTQTEGANDSKPADTK